MRRTVTLIITAVAVLAGLPAGATTPKTALIYGDSVTYESRSLIAARLAARGWTSHVRSYGGTAPCEWLQWLPADLAAYQPSIVGITTMGNKGLCVTAPAGTPEFYAQYTADLGALFSQITATGARVVFFTAPPVRDSARNAVVTALNRIGLDLAYQHRGVSVAGTVRSALSANGLYTDTKPCMVGECIGRVTVRSPDGVHLCPESLIWPGNCAVYSSGEVRFARAITNTLISPPPPKLA